MKKIFIFLYFLSLVSCSNQIVSGPEILHPPINLKIEVKTSPFAYYHVEFTSDNIEAGFAGYRVFEGSTVEEAKNAVQTFLDQNTLPEISDGKTCPASSFTSKDVPVTIQIGGNSQVAGYSCYLLSLNLTAGNYIAIRAFANRRNDQFSEAAVTQVP
ncbi:MAG: hypothetical protein D6767_01940 [Candidatus Hydrogenedentota bacterium]|nr:MAG: hypothetical protein D6767_01940 [Candidatus Hydrogenedentota bacterium]